MHDLTYAKEIVAAVAAKMRTLSQGTAIETINVAVSPLSHVKPETLKETYGALVKNTPLEHFTLNVRSLKLGMKCSACSASFSIEKPTFLCPECHSTDIAITDDKEFAIESIEVCKIA